MVDMNAVEERRAKLGIPKTVIASKCNVVVNTYDNWVKNPEMVSAKSAKSLAEALMIDEPRDMLAIFFAPNVQINVNTMKGEA